MKLHNRKLARCIGFLLVFPIFWIHTRGQTLDPNFYPVFSATGGIVYSLAVQSDQKIVVAGQFFEANGRRHVSVTRLYPNGSVDPDFINVAVVSSSSPGTINDVKIQPDGKVVLVGNFRQVSGQPRFGLARLNADGSLDTTFQNGMSGLDTSTAYSVAIQPDGKIVVGGQFPTVNGISCNNLVRLNIDGSIDNTFSTAGASSAVNAVSLQPDNKILIGGRFQSVQLVTRRRIARLNADGTLDPTFLATQTGANNDVASVFYQPDGKVLIAGDFSTVNGSSRSRIARLTSTGDLDTSFQNGLSGVNNLVNRISQVPNGQIMIGGFFTAVNGTNRNKFARLNPDGTLDLTCTSPIGPGTEYVYPVETLSDGKILAGGSFQNVGGDIRQHIARFNSDGSLDLTFGRVYLDEQGLVTHLARQPDGKILAAGRFRFVSGFETHNLVRLNADGTQDTSFGQGNRFADPKFIQKVAVLDDGKILVAGSFDIIGPFTRRHIVRLNSDGTVDATFQPEVSSTGVLDTFDVQPDGKIVIGGSFSFVSNQPRGNIARLNSDGSLDTTFMNGLAGANFAVLSVIAQPDGKTLIAGTFTQVNGTARIGLARLNSDGSLDSAFVANLNMFSMVRDAELQPDGKYLVGGTFTSINGANRNRIARVNSDGSVDATFQNGLAGANEEVLDVIRQTDGRVLLAGNFTSVNGVPRRVARLLTDGTLDTSFRDIDIGHPVQPYCATALAMSGAVLIGGYFSTIDGISRSGLVQLRSRQAPFDFDGDGKTDVGIFRPNVAEWWINRSGDGLTFATQFGTPTDRIVPADYTGDGKADIAFWRPSSGEWFVLRSEDFSFFAFPFGTSGDVPSPADYDGDGKVDSAVFRSSNASWYIRRSSDGGTTIQTFGASGDVPVPADYDGDGKADVAIFRPSLGQWWLNRSTAGLIAMTFGDANVKPTQGDFTGDGNADVAFFQPSTGEWFVLRSEDFSYYSFPFGAIGDTPAPGDYDGDGKFDATVFRSSNATWYSFRATSTVIQQFGQAGDRAIPSAFVP